MPLVNGFEILEQLRSIEAYHKIPIVIHSSNYDKRTLDCAFELGANYYTVKPCSYKVAISTLKHIIGRDWKTFKPERCDFLYDFESCKPHVITTVTS